MDEAERAYNETVISVSDNVDSLARYMGCDEVAWRRAAFRGGRVAIETVACCTAMSLSIGRRPVSRFFAAMPGVAVVNYTVERSVDDGLTPMRVLCLTAGYAAAIHAFVSPRLFRPGMAFEALAAAPKYWRRCGLLFMVRPLCALAVDQHFHEFAVPAGVTKWAASLMPDPALNAEGMWPLNTLMGIVAVATVYSIGMYVAVGTALLSLDAICARTFARAVLLPDYVPQPFTVRILTLPVVAFGAGALTGAWTVGTRFVGFSCPVVGHDRHSIARLREGKQIRGPPVSIACPLCSEDCSGSLEGAACCSRCPGRPLVACSRCVASPDHRGRLKSTTQSQTEVCAACRTELVATNFDRPCTVRRSCTSWKKWRGATPSQVGKPSMWCPDCDTRACGTCCASSSNWYPGAKETA